MPYEKKPWIGDVECGKKAFCACGETENAPYCDGSHSRKKTGKSPAVVEIEEEKRYAICQCGQSANHPFCDGTHKTC